MQEVCNSCLLFLIALAGGFIGMMMANTSVAVLVWICSGEHKSALSSRRWHDSIRR
jgi:uncharacterized membrane protein YhaH (DUF805 family)